MNSLVRSRAKLSMMSPMRILKLSGCIQQEKLKVILVLPSNDTQMETFEKTVSGGFSCVNTRLSFDTEILMPNLRECDYKI